MKSSPAFARHSRESSIEPPVPVGESIRSDFFARPTLQVAQDLIGTFLLRWHAGVWAGGQIVETEAYLASGDLACHSARGMTRSNAAMFAAAGTMYVYPIHAKFCFNFSTETSGVGSAVLVRAIQPLWGVSAMLERRSVEALNRLTRGPAMLCQALAIDRRLDGVLIDDIDELRVYVRPKTWDSAIGSSGRIGIRQSVELPYRFFAYGNPFVSGPKRLSSGEKSGVLATSKTFFPQTQNRC